MRRRTAWTSGWSWALPALALALWPREAGWAAPLPSPLAARDAAWQDAPVDARADELDYDRETGWLTAKRNVVLVKGDVKLEADYARVNMTSGDAHAAGHVRVQQGKQVWTGESLDFNFNTGIGSAENVTGMAEPFRIIGNRKMEKTGPNTFVLHDASITTCTNAADACHYHVRAREIEVVPEEYIRTRGAAWYFGSIPCMYLPYWKSDLEGNNGWRLRPGYSSRMGAFLLSGYRYPIHPALQGRTQLDLRSERGVAAGQDFRWRDPDGEDWRGDFSFYYADDQDPVDESDAPWEDIDSQRYRVRLRHAADLSPRDTVTLQAQHLSDPDMLEDFFEREYRAAKQPENYASYAHREDGYALGLLFNTRLNDFYGNVNRLPEATLDSTRAEFGESGVYYETRNSAAYLDRVFPDHEETDSYSAFRVDTDHRIYRPSRHFGFLNLIPRLGGRGTYYSDTARVESQSVVTTVLRTNETTDASGVVTRTVTSSTETNTVRRFISQGADTRFLFEAGAELSFKAFGVYGGPGDVDPRRHVLEPYADYTYQSEPTIGPEELYQFDDVDQLDKAHTVKLGVRNKWQAKRDNRAADLIYFDLYTIVRVEQEEGEDALDNVYTDLEWTPVPVLRVDQETVFDTAEGGVDTANTRIRYLPADLWSLEAEHRYRTEESSLLSGILKWMPNRRWSYELLTRYEAEESRLEEQGVAVQRNYDCLAWRGGVSTLPGYTRTDGIDVEDEWRVMLELWLTAFPDVKVGGESGW